jgi:deoxyribodipyrimidine photolyase
MATYNKPKAVPRKDLRVEDNSELAKAIEAQVKSLALHPDQR